MTPTTSRHLAQSRQQDLRAQAALARRLAATTGSEPHATSGVVTEARRWVAAFAGFVHAAAQ